MVEQTGGNAPRPNTPQIPGNGAGNRRVRRDPDSAKAEIIAAFEDALREMSFQELTVESLMARTGMTRSSFYHYFTALDDLVLGLLEHFEQDIRASVDPWLSQEEEGDDDDYRQATGDNLTRMFVVFQDHRRAVAALTQAAWGSTEVYQQWQQRVVDYYIDLTGRFIRHQIALGRSTTDNPELLGRALILMNHAVFTDHLTREDPDDPEVTAKVIADIWNVSIYG
jgi:AcrR family transcriptional regulator